MAVWYVFVVIWYIFPIFVCLDQEKSGNPDCRQAAGVVIRRNHLTASIGKTQEQNKAAFADHSTQCNISQPTGQQWHYVPLSTSKLPTVKMSTKWMKMLTLSDPS
jgi:hypothetical protein